MSSLNYGELCRLCLVKESVSIPIFDGEGDARRLFLKIAACLPVKVSREDRLPKKICDDCLYKLENQYLFWNSTANAEKQLLQWFDADSLQDEKKIVPTSNLETEQLDLKQEILDPDQGSELAKSLSRVEAVLAEEAGRTTRNAEEEEEEESEEEGSNSEESEEDDNDNDADEPSKDDNESDENYEELEPTTFVNVSLACDEAGPSGMQQQQQPSTAPSTSTSGPAASGEFNIWQVGQEKIFIPKEILMPDQPDTFSISPDENPDNPTKISINNCHGNNLKCCGKTYTNRYLFALHFKVHKPNNVCNSLNPGNYSCNICNKAFSDIISLQAHRFLRHPQSKTVAFNYVHKSFQCNVCKKTFDEEGKLNSHKIAHSTDRPFDCEICDKTFKRKIAVRTHMKTHTGIKEHVCDICAYATSNKSNLQYHKKRVHNRTLDCICEVCGKGFPTKPDLKYHMIVHTERQFKCKHCSKAFHKVNILIAHQQTHNSNRNKVHQCDCCGKRFAIKQTLLSHMRRHTVINIYRCEFCSKVLASAGSLAIHRRSHTGECPFTCELCTEAFPSKQKLTSHLKSHA